MTLHVALTHTTTYKYDRLVSLAPHTIRLRPAPHSRTPVLAYSLRVTPKDHFLNWQQDPFGNFLARVVMTEKTRELSVTVDLVADMAVINPFEFFIDERAQKWPFTYDAGLAAELKPYLEPTAGGPLLDRYVRDMDRVGNGVTLDFICDLNRLLSTQIKYLIRMEPGVQTPDETLKNGSGSCRDTGWLLVQILRRLGVAARFVSGYLIQLKPDVKPLDGPAGTDVDFTDLHAWAEAYVEGAGWIGLDPTSGLLAGEGHIPLAATPSPSSAAPISGAHDKAEVSFDFSMKVVRIRETPRVTQPYTDEQWKAILMAGHTVDEKLQAGDVRLSMGGEPTFVAVDDMDAPEWNNAAVGPTKRLFAESLVRRLRDRFGKGGMLHYGQGKWYPGEQLPRWSYSVYWRADGEALWENDALIDREAPPRNVTIEQAQQFSSALCANLGLPTDSPIAAYEDPGHFALVEQKLPIGVDPATNKLEDPQERARLVAVFDRGLGKPTGYVLPVQAWQTQDRGRRWATERWAFRRGRLYLQPGDSPIGFRLPIGSLPYLPPIDYPNVEEADPFKPHEPLPDRETLRQQRRTVTLTPQTEGRRITDELVGSVRTALAIEPRDGHLCVFLPPLADAEDYAALLAALEETARSTGQTVRLEGYAPPHDPRIGVIKVTPDPGVIEVNVQPAKTWEELVAITTTLYEDARQVRLGTEKFMLDGRHTGTGGGNHIVIGGMQPVDSPFLRRPDLLASVITYWQQHPSLSYLFSGMFIGPTSQAPRIDEARHDSLYEMELALEEAFERGAETPPWIVDRIFRHLLADSTGNTHRTEICIDKLYSPDGPTGRLGLVEFRSFEMPPHSRMSLAQQLLVRALIAWFWKEPYRRPLIRWGTALHDRFMLPHFVWNDFKSVVDDLNRAGFPVALDWFEPHFEFRFPRFGGMNHAGVKVEIRQALEPWHVLGEEGVVGGTARYVDSSLERVQVRVTSEGQGRHVVTCNGFPVPLVETGTFGETIGGVRYRAWQPPSALHPTIAPHVPLTFDVMDTWTGRSIGGCRYHVSHPGGRSFETFPVNAFEAEGRRLSRFEGLGHTPGAATPRKAGIHPDFPFTLDLRRVSSKQPLW
jgi:uncharacterized protein (DUF2126 family)/transglutaminase-like putative cysteine protease